MKNAMLTGISFGLTSGVITTLGLIVGLNFATYSEPVVVGGILLIAVADSLSDAMGMHISEESRNGSSNQIAWQVALFTFLAKLFFALTFIVPFIFFPLISAVYVSILWGIIALIVLNIFIAKSTGNNPYELILEHVLLTIGVIIITYLIGNFINQFIG